MNLAKYKACICEGAGEAAIIRILDSRRENFRLSKAYAHKVDVINIITAPELKC